MNTDFDANRPKLKKIKRPINRTVPVGGIGSQSANMQQQPSQKRNKSLKIL